MSRTSRSRFPLLLLLAIAACGEGEPPAEMDLSGAIASITADELLAHTRILASDAYEGRAPGSAGEDSTVAYLTARFRELGLQPGNPDGSYVQEVPLVAFTATPTASFTVNGRAMPLRFRDDYVASSRRFEPRVRVEDSEVVFVGYGVVAPEFGWNDYAGVDVRGKTVVMLINDPPVPDPLQPGVLDSTVFRGRAMTYYGRWTYKYEQASEMGAAAAIIIHETEPAAYPWEVVVGSWTGEDFDIRPEGENNRVQAEGWMTREKAVELFRATGQDFEALKAAAAVKGFQAVPLGATADFDIQTEIREIRSRNVVAKLEGSGERSDEYVVYTAHWDHLGRQAELEGDQIFNGALDNATGTAALLEIAEAFTELPSAPQRSILFLAVTAEESGLLGAKYYAENPLYPLTKTVANINMDGANQWGRTSDIVVVGYGNTTLDDVLREVASEQGRMLSPDPEPEKGFYYRSDHFEFAKQGVPALNTDPGVKYIGRPASYSQEKRDQYTNEDYHKPTDEVKPDWDLSGTAEDAALLFQVGYRVAQDPALPQWSPGTEFRARREEMLRAAEGAK